MQTSATASHKPRQAIVVLGMHRSGTSVLTRMLSLRGAALPRNLMPASPTNETGYWESSVIKTLNNKVFSAAGTFWYDWKALPPDWLNEGAALEKHRADADEALASEFGNVDLLILKDPRIARMVPFWTSILERADIAPNFVLALRNPQEVAASLESRNAITPTVAHLSWLRHMIQAEFDTRGHPRVVISYQNLLQDWAKQLKRAEDHLNVTWQRTIDQMRKEADDLLLPGLRHFQDQDEKLLNDQSVFVWARQAYDVLLKWSETGEDSADFAALDAIRQKLDAAELPFLPVTSALHTAKKKIVALKTTDAKNLAATKKKLAQAEKRAKTLDADLSAAAAAHAKEIKLLKAKLKSLNGQPQKADAKPDTT